MFLRSQAAAYAGTLGIKATLYHVGFYKSITIPSRNRSAFYFEIRQILPEIFGET
jgi:hypothetical protein